MRVLVVAKAPVPGLAKTRLGALVGDAAAARLAAAALMDTLRAATTAAGPRGCHLALTGDLEDATDAFRLRQLLSGWMISMQRGSTFAERLVNAHRDAGPGPVVQVGMDTPQVTAELLADTAARLSHHDTVLGAADDGGWWVLGRTDPGRVDAIGDVPMSTSTTYVDTRRSLIAHGSTVAAVASLRDVDTVDDAHAVAEGAPDTEFARVWAEVAAG